MKYTIIGTDTETKMETRLLLDAQDEAGAKAAAKAKGIRVDHIVEMGTPKPAPVVVSPPIIQSALLLRPVRTIASGILVGTLAILGLAALVFVAYQIVHARALHDEEMARFGIYPDKVEQHGTVRLTAEQELQKRVAEEERLIRLQERATHKRSP